MVCEQCGSNDLVFDGSGYRCAACDTVHVLVDAEPAEEHVPEPVRPAKKKVPKTTDVGKNNALRSANDYLDTSAFSYEGLIDQLEFEGYTHEEAVYGADACGADWFDQAKRNAREYLQNVGGYSKKGLAEQLEYEKFTHDEAAYGADRSGADWYEQAHICAKNYQESCSFSYEGMLDQLKYEKFTDAEAEYGADVVFGKRAARPKKQSRSDVERAIASKNPAKVSSSPAKDLAERANPAKVSSSGKSDSSGCGCLGWIIIIIVAFLVVRGCTASDSDSKNTVNSNTNAAAVVSNTANTSSQTSHSTSSSSGDKRTPFDYERIMKGTIYRPTKDCQEYKAGEDMPVGTYLFIIEDQGNGAPGWIAIQSQGHMGGGGGYVSWGIMPVREGQTLLASRVRFCLLDECDQSQIPEGVEVFKGKEQGTQNLIVKRESGRYDAVCGAAESIKEQYPGISWSSQWEELSNMGYSYEEIAWAIGG